MVAVSSKEEDTGDRTLSRRLLVVPSVDLSSQVSEGWSESAGRLRVQSSPASSSRANREEGDEGEMSGKVSVAVRVIWTSWELLL
jgi:hypothetical protein